MPTTTRARSRARFESRARIIKAMAHPSRLLIIDQLAREATCVCRLTELVGADISTVSKHLAVLKNAGIVRDERRGVQIFYSLRCPCVLKFISCIEAVAETTAREELRALA
jgi:ArsR family transcriptional regulator